MPGFEQVQTPEGLLFLKIPVFEEAGCTAVFSSRLGGISKAPYNSLNLGYHVGDDIQDAVENRRRLCDALGWSLEHTVSGEQIHGDCVKVVTREDRGKGAFTYASALAETDALVANQHGIVLSSFYADCVPLFFFDPVKKVVALAHAGWKGTFLAIGQKTIAEMQKVFRTVPEDCLVAIGPSIGACCYEVDEKLYQTFKGRFTWLDKVFKSNGEGKWRLDLWKTNYIQLLEMGIREENIIESRICTSCNTELFFSHRKENGRTGRMGAFIALR